jgi:hypothetical protein
VSVVSTVLIFVIIPLVIVVIVAALSIAGSDRNRKTRRYRPGRRYDFQPIWFLSSPEQVGSAPDGQTSEQRAQTPAIEAGIIEDSSGVPVRPGPTGGASDSW